MTHKPPCSGQRAHRRTANVSHPISARSFQQTASPPQYKASFRGSQQGTTSYVPYRRSKPPHKADVLTDADKATTRNAIPADSEEITTDSTTDTFTIRRQPLKWQFVRYLLVASIILYSLYAVYVKWVDPFLTNIQNHWQYGDARVSITSMTIQGKQRNVLGIGYHGNVEIIILPDSTNPHSQALAYIAPQPFHDAQNRVVTLHPAYVNTDTYLDIIVEVEGTNGVSPVLYGKADGTFQWNSPPA
jgi:hypothetical protein